MRFILGDNRSNELLVLNDCDDLLKHLKVRVRLDKREHDNKADIARLRRVVHSTPRNGMLEHAHRNSPLVYMLGLAMRNRNVNSLGIECRRKGLFALMQCVRIGFQIGRASCRERV